MQNDDEPTETTHAPDHLNSGLADREIERKGAAQMKHRVDIHVGKRIRHRRWMIGMTQQKLAEIIGIKFQQIQKYETGTNRVSASRLWDIAHATDVPVSFFFEGLDQPDSVEMMSVLGETSKGDLLVDREAQELVRSYYQIPKEQRRRLFDLARVLSAD